MAKQTIGIGTTANDGTGDPLRTAFDKANDNFTEVYGKPDISFANNTLTLTRADGTTDTADLSSLQDDTVRTVTAGGNTLDASETLAFTAGSGISITESGGAVTITNSLGDSDTTYTAGSGLDLTNEVFSVEADLRDGITHIGVDTGDYIQFTADTQMDFYVNGSNEMRLEADGDLHVDGDVIAASTTVSSDENLKDNISTYKNALNTLKEIKGVSFEWKKDGKKSGGVIAQDVEKVLPELVGSKKSLKGGKETLTVDYNGLIGVLIQAVKELSHKVEKLENR